ncbi:phosphatidylglycerol lysyltransferase domain-containing protein [Vulgatibacter sp.]|uniref:phosphatidylglycerol lysyltransferase domain-containing protein n=1 Tax=Vulgatibacter sp. TaxID=1971226 RepID=UPI00356A9264
MQNEPPAERLRARQQARVLGLLRRYGWNATSFQVLEPGLRYWFCGADAAVAYVDTGRAFVVAGAPIAPAARVGEVAARFGGFAARCRRRVRFFAVVDRFLEAAPFDAVQVGEQPAWDPGEWPRILRESRSLREQLRRARARGVVVRQLAEAEAAEGPVRAHVEALVARWLGSRHMAPMGFLVEVHPFGFASERRYFAAERDGRIVGFLAAVPIYARGGWFFEDLLRDPAAPNGTAELLVDAAMRAVAAEGSRYVTLGLAPLAGVSGWLASARRLGRRLYDFAGLASFKAKLRPQAWEPIHLAYPRGERGIVALVDALAAFSRGGLFRFGLETLLRVPTVVIEALAVALVPWTIALALTDHRWFPAPWMKWFWVAFDVGLFVGLLALAKRWRHGLATALAVLVTADAVVSWVQALVFNLPRLRGAGDAVVVAAGVLAPTLAAVLLWRARWHRRRYLPR